ncbi:MAG: HAMP domain-containing protein [Chloroflexi bacterium]|nr:HAMP domain-containing protein [Chloroflexota bacterium]
MLYVAAGLAAMFGVLAVIGLGAIDQATQLVFQERLATAYTTAGILERDLGRAAHDAVEGSPGTGGSGSPDTAVTLLGHFDEVSPYLFFRVTGVWLVDSAGRVADAAGSPQTPGAGDVTGLVRDASARPVGGYLVGRALGPVPGAVPFAAIAVRLPDAGQGERLAVIHTVSINGSIDYDPQTYGSVPGSASPDPAATAAGGATGYHLEVVDPNGIAVLGIGSDERPGEPSHHFSAIQPLVASGGAAAMIHQPDAVASFEPHVMAVVPLAGSPFYVVLEQPIDIALALPNQLRTQLAATIAVGFVGALVVAWITTRHVVKPTEQLTAAAGRMAGGDLTSPVGVQADDEVGLLAESLEAMREQLQAARAASDRMQSELERRVADRTARLNQLLGQTIDAQEAERLRLARELHDETAQSLAALTIALDRARDQLGASTTSSRDHIAEARATAGRLLAETRRLIVGLRPAALDDLGLVAAIRAYADTSLAPEGIAFTVESSILPRLEGHVEVALFRIVQEALTNVARHARARNARVELASESGEIAITIDDDGIGFAVDSGLGATSSAETSFGLLGMQERVRLLGGEIGITSGPQAGTRIVIRVPLATEGT